MSPSLSRRALLTTAGVGTLAVLAGAHRPSASAASSLVAANGSQRAVFHMTPPSGWLCDPQRPVDTNGAYQLYYLHSDVNNGPGGWDHATTVDGVDYTHHGTVLPLTGDEPVWSGSAVIDVDGTAGYGAGAVIVLATVPTDGVRRYQEQYLAYSTDGGFSFTWRPDPVIVNTDGRAATTPQEIDNAEWFRDPKTHWDQARGEWVCVIGRARYAAFYTSPNLIDWTLQRNFDYPDHDLGGIECPDIFTMTADDGTVHWVLGASMDAYTRGLPMTYAYWTGTWTGTEFLADDPTPQWLDWGWDWYAAVTWPAREAPDTVRLATAWMNNWKYAARDVPTDASDGYNGQNSITRELRLSNRGGVYRLLSAPVAALDASAASTTALPDLSVTGESVLGVGGRAYSLDATLSWDQARNVGLTVGRSSDGARGTNIGVYEGEVYVDRGPSELAGFQLSPYHRAFAPVDPAFRQLRLRVYVDTQSVEVFVDDGLVTLSQQVHFTDGDTGISFYSDGGPLQVSAMTLRTFGSSA
ncbi:glycoside hydrolase family 32 protein [Mycetocola reblochoni]|uniref:Sucrose-6-phosphate hydrolase n=2 Tax=Mycetocola reblochoni TaxID=331618 RepID=A0A1R4KCM0_9MICO|nr:glycoside hydrolase family 32 protein [Mycetocola reblochoni]RLP69279.1 glycoside hydrolase family 32 protein [Mycetocola reblochoni]SJN42056.1 Sucrose-6-phosphate hydrolase [Mycetocola reblochoni REB411]